MKNNQVKFEYYKTNKGNVVINVESPKLGFSIHGDPELVTTMYEDFLMHVQDFPKPEQFKGMKHMLIENELEEVKADETEE